MKRGFTLLELLVTTGIMTLVTVILTQVLFSTIHVNTKTEIMKEVKQNGDFALGIIIRMIQNGRAITSACDGTTASSITLTNADGGETTFTCLPDSDVLRIASNSALLTSPKVTLTGVSCTDAIDFVCTTAAGGTKSVKISFSLAQKGTPPSAYETAAGTFQTTVSVRND